MKKLFAMLLTLLMILTLPVAAMADEVDNTEDTAAAETTAPVETEASEETETYRCTCENCVTEEAETEAPASQSISFGFFPGTLSQTLPIMGMGMLGIFLVTCVIILAVLVLSKIGKKGED